MSTKLDRIEQDLRHRYPANDPHNWNDLDWLIVRVRVHAAHRLEARAIFEAISPLQRDFIGLGDAIRNWLAADKALEED